MDLIKLLTTTAFVGVVGWFLFLRKQQKPRSLEDKQNTSDSGSASKSEKVDSSSDTPKVTPRTEEPKPTEPKTTTSTTTTTTTATTTTTSTSTTTTTTTTTKSDAKGKGQTQQPKKEQQPQQAKKGAAKTGPRISRYAYPPQEPLLITSPEDRFALALSVGEECQLKDELKELLESNPSPVAYDGFEPSGRMHIAQGVMKKINVDKLTKCGFTYIFWVADWFAFLNHKMGGDLEKIKTVGRYFIEVWKALGMNMDRVKFLWASDEITSRGDDYWGLVLDISTKFSLTRVKRCGQIMGRTDTSSLSSSQILYPCMQSADIFFMEVDVCQLGVDQRKVNMLAREYSNRNKTKCKRPVVLSHHMLLGLKKGQDKMSKSDPDSAIFMEDTYEEISRKITKHAFCPPGQVYETEKVMVNPVLDHFVRVFKGLEGKPVVIKDQKFGTYAELEKAFIEAKVAPDDLKAALSVYLNEIITPIRESLAALSKTVSTKFEKQVFHKDALSLKKDEDTIGKTNEAGTIFLDDTADAIATKCKAAYCPPKVFYEKTRFINPCMDYYKNLVFESFPVVKISREEKFGGNLEFKAYKDFEAAYIKGEIDPADVKQNLVKYIDDLIRPVREHFQNNQEAKELLEKVKVYRVTK